MFLNLKRAASGVWWFGTPFRGNSFGSWLATCMLQLCTQVLVLGRTGDYFCLLFVFGTSYTLVMR